MEMFRCSRVLQVWGSGEGSRLHTGQVTLGGRGIGASFTVSVLLPTRDGRGKLPSAREEGRGEVVAPYHEGNPHHLLHIPHFLPWGGLLDRSKS